MYGRPRCCAKLRLSKFRGMHPQTFLPHLKVTEFRYNLRHQDIGRVILGICRENPPQLVMTHYFPVQMR